MRVYTHTHTHTHTPHHLHHTSARWTISLGIEMDIVVIVNGKKKNVRAYAYMRRHTPLTLLLSRNTSTQV
jgi:hypothetical protein